VDDDQGPLTLSPGVDRVDVAVGWKSRARVREVPLGTRVLFSLQRSRAAHGEQPLNLVTLEAQCRNRLLALSHGTGTLVPGLGTEVQRFHGRQQKSEAGFVRRI
jgi:hypothetical protein